MRAPLVFLLSLLPLCWAGVVLDAGFPMEWARAKTDFPDLPKTDNKYTPDPWNFLHRQSFIRQIIKSTDPHMKSMGPGDHENPWWGPALRVSWMLTSGRLADPTGATTCGADFATSPHPTCISHESWFGCMHYYSSAMPYLSAAHNGFISDAKVDVEMQNPAGAEVYCNTYEACKAAHPDVMAKWDAFFTGLKEKAESAMPDHEKKDAILGLYWAAQAASWHLSSNVCEPKLNHYNPREKQFAVDWLYVVEYSAIALFQSSLEQAPKFLIPMPGRIMTVDDHAPNIKDMTFEENQMLWAFDWTRMSDKFFGGQMKNMWRKVCCSPEGRQASRDLLISLMLNPLTSTASFVQVMMHLHHCQG